MIILKRGFSQIIIFDLKICVNPRHAGFVIQRKRVCGFVIRNAHNFNHAETRPADDADYKSAPQLHRIANPA